MKEKLKKISSLLIQFLILIFPLFYLPFSIDSIYFPRAILFSFLISLSLFFWFLASLFQKEITFRGNNNFYLVLFFFFLFSSISTFFSLYRPASLWGFPLIISESLVFLFFSLIFVFLLLHVFEKKIEIYLNLILLLIPVSILVFISIFQIYLKKTLFGIFFLDFLGGLTQSSVFLAILIPILISFFFQTKGFWKVLFGILITIFLLFILNLGVRFAWVLIFILTVILSLFTLEGKKGEINLFRAGILSLVLIFSIVFYFLSSKILPPVPEINLGFLPHLQILFSTLKENTKNLFFGTGPGTFIFDYSKYRPVVLNQTIAWGMRFPNGASAFLDLLTTKGILAGISFLSLFILTSILIFKKILKEKLTFIDIGIFISTFGIFLSSLFISFNISLWFLFWFLLGSTFYILSKETKVDFSAIPLLKSLFFVIFCTIFTFCLIFSFIQFQKYLANINYKSAVLKAQKNLDLAIEKMKKAIQKDKESDIYWRDLSQLYLLKANQVFQSGDLPLEKKVEMVNPLIREGILAIEKAKEVSPNNVGNWNVRGFFYRNLIGFFKEAGEISLASYQKAIELEPNSPYSFGEMGRVYILLAQDADKRGDLAKKTEYLNLAKNQLEKALKKKPDYAPAHYLMAVAFSQEGKVKEAISKLEETRLAVPNDLGVQFQLSLLYYQSGELEKAKNILEKLTKDFPNYFQARYLLGLVYDKSGEKEKAKKEFEKVLELNPDNQEVKKILENLAKGLPALEGISTPGTISEEKPKELQP
jgi:tetratricopeptide (TPR) repeat protein